MFIVPISRDTQQLSRLFDDTLDRFFGPIAGAAPTGAAGTTHTGTTHTSAARRWTWPKTSATTP